MFKNLVIAILLAITLTFCFGQIATEWFDVHVVLDDHVLSPLAGIGMAAVISCVMVILGFLLAISLFGVLAFVAFVIFASVLVAGVGVFWPVLLAGAIIYWLVRDNKKATSV